MCLHVVGVVLIFSSSCFHAVKQYRMRKPSILLDVNLERVLMKHCTVGIDCLSKASQPPPNFIITIKFCIITSKKIPSFEKSHHPLYSMNSWKTQHCFSIMFVQILSICHTDLSGGVSKGFIICTCR